MKSIRQPTPNSILSRIYPVKFENLQGVSAHGTSFVIEYKGSPHMITAAHVVEKFINFGPADSRGFAIGTGSISIYHDRQWNVYSVRVSKHDISKVPSESASRYEENIDVAILEVQDFPQINGEGVGLSPMVISNIRNFSVTVFGFPKPFLLMPVEQLPLVSLKNGLLTEPPRKNMELMTNLTNKRETCIGHVLNSFSSEGMSGGPVICEVDEEFFVIAIVSEALDSSLGFTYCSPIECAVEMLKKSQTPEQA